MTILWMAMVGAGALSSLLLVAAAVRRWPVLGAIMIAASVLIAWEAPNPPPLASVAGTNIFAFDVIAVVFLLVGLLRLNQLGHNLGAVAWIWLVLGGLLVISLLRGLLESDFGTTFNEFRTFLWPYAAMTWGMSLRWSHGLTTALLRNSSLALGWCLVLVTGYHILRFGFGGASEFVDPSTGIDQTSRPLASGQALMLLLCAIPTFWFWGRERKTGLLISGLVFTGVVVIVQQRTVWGVAVAVAIAVFLTSRARTRGKLILSGIAAMWLFAIVLTSGIATDLLSRLDESATNSGTYDARVGSWLALISKSVSEGLGTVVFGDPMGSGFGRFEGAGRWVEFSPHNWYLTIYLRVGLLGLGALLIFLSAVCLSAFRTRSNSAAIAILIATVFYGWAYSWPWYSAIFLSWAIIASRADGREETQRSTQKPAGAKQRTIPGSASAPMSANSKQHVIATRETNVEAVEKSRRNAEPNQAFGRLPLPPTQNNRH